MSKKSLDQCDRPRVGHFVHGCCGLISPRGMRAFQTFSDLFQAGFQCVGLPLPFGLDFLGGQLCRFDPATAVLLVAEVPSAQSPAVDPAARRR